MKKILIALLSFLTLFLIGGKIKADANSEWTLEADEIGRASCRERV